MRDTPDVIVLDFDPVAAKQLKPGKFITFAQAPGLRFERTKNRTKHGRLEVERMFEYDLSSIAKRKAADITDDDAERFLKKVVDRGSPNSALRLRRELAAAWRTAKLRPNPWPDALGNQLAQGER